MAGWEKLGLKPRVAKTIDNYRNKGGRFYKPEDMKKIWGLPDGFYDRVKNYISLPANETSRQIEPREFLKQPKKDLSLEINTADSSAFIALPGIGNKLAARIINFREKLGGFYAVSQVGETYGLPDSTFQKIKSWLHIDKAKVRKMSINTVTKDELKLHPYIRWNLANAIVEYRNQHGLFTDLEQLSNLMLIDEKTLQRIIPYLAL